MPPSRGQSTSVDQSKEIRCKVLAVDDEARTPANYEAATGAPAALGEQVAGDPTIHQAHQEVTQSGSNTNDETATPFTIEFCSGTAGLTAQIRKLGCEASFGVDHIVKAGAKAPVRKLDLTKEGSLEMAKDWLSNPLCRYAHFGIPCGTCSRAREIPLPGGGPKPLRSEDEPEGLSGLSSYDQQRVDLANSVYDTCCKLILHCIAIGVDWSLEQPKRSIFWWTKYWKTVLAAT